jgi:hypothetical protein
MTVKEAAVLPQASLSMGDLSVATVQVGREVIAWQV